MNDFNLKEITKNLDLNENKYSSIQGIKINCFSDLSVHGGKLQ